MTVIESLKKNIAACGGTIEEGVRDMATLPATVKSSEASVVKEGCYRVEAKDKNGLMLAYNFANLATPGTATEEEIEKAYDGLLLSFIVKIVSEREAKVTQP